VLAHVERPLDALAAPVVADGLRDRRDVGLGERAVERRAPVSAGAEADELGRIARVRLSLVVIGLGAGPGHPQRLPGGGRAPRVGLPLVVLALEPGQVHQHRLRSRLAGQRRERRRLLRVVDHRSLRHTVGHGFTWQMSAAYSAMVRSLENFPELATFRMALRAHASGSAYSARLAPAARGYNPSAR